MTETINFDSLWTASDQQYDQHLSQQPDDFGSQIGAGVDLGQALLYRGGQSVAEAFGFSDSAFGQAMVDGKSENMAEVAKVTAHPLYEEGEFSFRGLLDQVGRGIGTVATALPAIAAAPLAPAIGVSGSTGALVAGGLMSGVMNIGDIGLKAEDMDEAYTASMADLGTGLALGALEPLAGAKFIKALTPAIKSTSPELMASINAGNASALSGAIRGQVAQTPSMARQIGQASLGSGITEGVQDFATTIAATNSASYWDQFDVEESLKESAVEALVGGILGMPFGVGSSVMTKAQQSADLSYASQLDAGIIQYNPKSNEWVKNQEKIPVTETKLGHLYSKYLAPFLGETGSKAVAQINTPEMKKLVGKFNQTSGSLARRAGIRPIHAESMIFKSEYGKGMATFMTLSNEDALAVHDQRVMPEGTKEEKDAKNAAYSALPKESKKASNELSTFLDFKMRKDLEKYGIDAGLFEGRTYFPLHGRIDYKKLKADSAAFKAQALAVAKERGIKLSENKIDAYIARIKNQGYEHFGNATETSYLDTYQKNVNNFIDKGMTTEEAQSKAKKIMQRSIFKSKSGAARVNTQNAVETHRMLAELPQDFWSNWLNPDSKVQDSIYSYYEMMSERLAHAKEFGANNEVFYDKVAKVLDDAKAQGINYNTETVVNDLANMMNLSQRIPTRNLDVSQGEGIRTAQNAIRAGLSVTLLPLSILPSLAEVFVVASKTGQTGKAITSAGKLTARIIKEQFKHGRGLSFKDASQLVNKGDIIQDLGITAYELKNTAAARLGDNEIGGRITNLENFFYNMTLTPQWTEALRMTSAILAEQGFRADLVKYSTAIKEGNIEEQLRIGDKFAEAGLNISQAYNWHLRGGKKNEYYNEKFRVGVLNVVEDTVMRPRMVQKPAWMADERFKLIAQLKSFSIVFNNVVMKGWYNSMVANGTPPEKIKQAAAIAPYIGMMLATQVMASGLRELLKTGDTERWEDKDAIGHLITSIAYIGGLSFAIDPFRASNYGVDPSTTIAGPAFGKGNDLINGISAIMSGSMSPEDVVSAVLKDVSRSFPLIPALLE
jgi:hypothetical protein